VTEDIEKRYGITPKLFWISSRLQSAVKMAVYYNATPADFMPVRAHPVMFNRNPDTLYFYGVEINEAGGLSDTDIIVFWLEDRYTRAALDEIAELLEALDASRN
jgi:hypothetical protein